MDNWIRWVEDLERLDVRFEFFPYGFNEFIHNLCYCNWGFPNSKEEC